MLADLGPTVPASVQSVPQQEVEHQCDPSISAFAFKHDPRQRKERRNVDTAPTTTCNRSHNIQNCKMVWQSRDGLFPLMTHRTITTFNINGLYCDARQQMLRDFVYRNDLDIFTRSGQYWIWQMPGNQLHYSIVAKRRGTLIVARDTKPITTMNDSWLGQQLQEFSASKYIWLVWQYRTARSRKFLHRSSLNLRNIPQECTLEGGLQLRVMYSWLQKQT
jgi:hypothetical protein